MFVLFYCSMYIILLLHMKPHHYELVVLTQYFIQPIHYICNFISLIQ